MPMYEAHIEDENEDEVENTCTGRYCDPSSVADELEGFINELINDTSKTNRVIQEIETLTGEDYDSLDIEKFEKFLSANHHLIKEISYTLGFIQSSIEISKLELDDKLKSFSDLLHEKFDRF